MFAGMAATRFAERPTTSEQAPPWTPGIAALMRNLARRGLLPEPQ
jgi:fumarylacetoacetate (FAA) hydrolase family protein